MQEHSSYQSCMCCVLCILLDNTWKDWTQFKSINVSMNNNAIIVFVSQDNTWKDWLDTQPPQKLDPEAEYSQVRFFAHVCFTGVVLCMWVCVMQIWSPLQ